MNREQVFSLIRAHLADELEVDPGPRSARRRASRRIWRRTRSTSTRSFRSSRTPTASGSPTRRRRRSSPSVRRSTSCSRAVPWTGTGRRPRARAPTLSERLARTPRRRSRQPPAKLRRCSISCPADLAAPVFTHASWTTSRADSYERLAFLGDSVLGARGDHPPLSAPRGRALRRRAPDQDPRPGGVGPLVPRRGRAARRARAPAGGGARGRRRAACPPWSPPSACSHRSSRR